jgi:hypothetical protein
VSLGGKRLNIKLKAAYVLSIIIVVLSLISALGGIFLDNLYRDNTFVTSAWHGNDLITLFVAVPGLVAALLLMKRGSQRAQLVWLGMLDYMLYNFAFYLFGASFNRFFLLYVVLFALSIYALVFALLGIDVKAISQKFSTKTPVKFVGGYMLFVAIGLSTVYIAQSLGFVATGQVPQIVTKTGHPTSIVFALDLSLLIPALILGAIWLLKRQPWGYVLAAISTIKGATYTLVLTAGSIVAANAGVPGASAELPLWIFLTVAGLFATTLLMMNMKSSD